ncbi:hypothetical protein GCM10020295_47510 [Streptomyces cinereospinus]
MAESMPARLGGTCPKVFANFPRDAAFSGRIFPMDDMDRKILAELQQDGRLTVTELAARVRLSVSPCHRPAARAGAVRGDQRLPGRGRSGGPWG